MSDDELTRPWWRVLGQWLTEEKLWRDVLTRVVTGVITAAVAVVLLAAAVGVAVGVGGTVFASGAPL